MHELVLKTSTQPQEVEKIGVNSYKVLLNFNDSAWNINKH